MKKVLCIALILCCMVLGINAQSQTKGNHTIKGVIVDSITKTPEFYACARLFPFGVKTKVALQAVYTLDDGVFKFEKVKEGKYKVEISASGRTTISRSVVVEANKKEIQMDTFKVYDEVKDAGAVMVVAKRPFIKAEVDKISYQMSEDPEAKTNTTLEMLRKVPMVTVDGEDNIQVNGSSSFKVYVNGKPNQMMSSNPSEILKSYPASVIKKIEVITNPGAKYDAEGVAGVLNIITEGDTKTTGYSISPSFNYDSHGYRGSLFGMTQVGKLMLSAHYSVGHNKRPASTGYSEREVFNDDTNHFLTSNSRSQRSGTYQFGSLEASYEFDEHNLLSISAGLHGHNSKENSTTQYLMTDINGNPVYSYDYQRHSKNSRFGINASADFQHTFNKPGEMLTFSYKMGMNPNRNKQYTDYLNITDVPFALTDLYSDPDNKSDEHTFQLDYTTPLDSIQTLSTGVKYIYRINKSDNLEMKRTSGTGEEYVEDESRSLLYRHEGNILAAYAEYGLKVKAFTAKAGARYEFYKINVNYPDGKRPDFDKNLQDLVPSISLGYNLNETQMLKFGYNMRIGRPGINSLSPYVNHDDPLNISYGNPNLTSEHAHNLELGFNSFKQNFSFNATLTYSITTDGITQYSYIKDNVVNTTSDNFMHRKSVALNIFTNFSLTPTTSVNLKVDGRYSDFKVNELNSRNTGWSVHCFGGITQKLPAKFKLGIWGGGASPDINLQGKGSKFYFYSMNLSRTFLKEDRLEITLQANNFIGRYHYFTNTTTTNDYRFYSKNRVDFMRFGIGVKYRIGTLKAKVKKVARTIENDDNTSNQQDNQQGNQEN